ncbi:MAG: tRNA glutamyl-Q(34) synthetase GluQRS [Sphingomonadaceae bacterium]
MLTTRFAPSPNGPLHLGHAWSAIVAHDIAKAGNGRFLLRIEDIDGTRSKPELADAFRQDLAWLGLDWEEVAPQSTRLDSYVKAADRLRAMDLLYPCQCSRAEIAAAATASGPEGPIYPGTCKGRELDKSLPCAWRLDMDGALRQVTNGTGPLLWHDNLAGIQHADPSRFGDIVLLRKEAPASYHLAATLDDASDGVTLVTRGLDLFSASHIHRLLQELLGLPVPQWHHHGLLVDDNGQKLAKRRGSASLADRRLAGEDGRALAEQLRAANLRAANLPAGIFLKEAL